MTDPIGLLLAASAGGCGAVSALALLGPERRPSARGWLRRRGRRVGEEGVRGLARAVFGARGLARLRHRVGYRLEQAGISVEPEVIIALAALASAVAGVAAALAIAFLADLASAVVGGLVVAIAVPALLARQVAAAGTSRRQLLLGQLGPILELVSLELGGGAPPMLALESVLAHSRSELAAAMRAQLIGSRVAGSASFDGRLSVLGDRLQLPALHSMAMILGLSRDYGSAVGQGVRALAADLRRARRRRVIELSRGALNRVLIPAAVGVLLPFMAILLFPAVAVLMRSFA
jgi:Flp pilus assembly protein TadB